MKRDRRSKDITILYEKSESSLNQTKSSDVLLQDGGLSNVESASAASDVHRKSVTQSHYPQEEIGFVRLDFFNPHCNLASVQSFSFSHIVQLFPWSSKLNEDFIKKALETVLTLLAAQAGPLLFSCLQDDMQKFHVRRELCSELQIFHEYVKKSLVEVYNFDGKENNIFLRRKQDPLKKTDSHLLKKKNVKRVPEDSDDDSVSAGSNYYNDGNSGQSIDIDATIQKAEKMPDLFEKDRPKMRSFSERNRTREMESLTSKDLDVIDVSTPVGKVLTGRKTRGIFTKHIESVIDLEQSNVDITNLKAKDSFILAKKKIVSKESGTEKIDSSNMEARNLKMSSEVSDDKLRHEFFVESLKRRAGTVDKKSELSISPTKPRSEPTMSSLEYSISLPQRKSDPSTPSPTVRVLPPISQMPQESMIYMQSQTTSSGKKLQEVPSRMKTSGNEKSNIVILHKTPKDIAESESSGMEISETPAPKGILKKFNTAEIVTTEALQEPRSSTMFSKIKDSLQILHSKSPLLATNQNLNSESDVIPTGSSGSTFGKISDNMFSSSSAKIVKFDSKSATDMDISSSIVLSVPSSSLKDVTTLYSRNSVSENSELEVTDNWSLFCHSSDTIVIDDDIPKEYDKKLQNLFEYTESDSEEDVRNEEVIAIRTDDSIVTVSPDSVSVDYIHFLSLWFDYALKTKST